MWIVNVISCDLSLIVLYFYGKVCEVGRPVTCSRLKQGVCVSSQHKTNSKKSRSRLGL